REPEDPLPAPEGHLQRRDLHAVPAPGRVVLEGIAAGTGVEAQRTDQASPEMDTDDFDMGAHQAFFRLARLGWLRSCSCCSRSNAMGLTVAGGGRASIQSAAPSASTMDTSVAVVAPLPCSRLITVRRDTPAISARVTWSMSRSRRRRRTASPSCCCNWSWRVRATGAFGVDM